MKKLHTYESFLNEAKKSKKLNSNERSVLLLDGTGSAGKSFTLKEIGAKKPNKGEKVGDDDYEVIAFDDYFPHGEGVSMSDPKDPANQKRWQLEEEAGIPKEARDWAKKSGDFACNAAGYKKMFQDSANARTAILKKLKTVKNPTKEEVLKAAGEKIGNDGDMSKEDFDKLDPKEALKSLIDTQEKKIAYNQKIADETPDYKHPDMPEGEFGARWYMAQQYKKSTAKNVVFDDVEPNINKFLPKGTVKTVLLHSDPDKLGSNIASREKTDPRNPEYVFNDYLNKYEFVKEKPKDGEGDPGKPTTRAKMEKTLKGLTKSAGLSLSTVNDDYIKNWLSKAGMNDDGTYYMKVRGEYLKEVDPILLNSDKDGDYLKKFKQIAEDEEKRVKDGEKKVEDSEEESQEEIKTIEDTGTSHLFSGIDPKVAKKMKEVKVNIRMPNRKIKSITIETLMDFVPIDPNDPEEKVMIKAQSVQYEGINEIRIKQKLKELIPFKKWLLRNVELAKDNKEYQARIKAKTLEKMNKAKAGAKDAAKTPVKVPVKESFKTNHIHTFESFLNEAKEETE
jgi:hypothetical protein